MEIFYQILVIVLVIISVFLLIMRYVVSHFIQKKLILALENQDQDTFTTLMQKKVVKFLIPPFNIHYMAVNMALMLDNKKIINEEFDLLLSMRKDKRQTLDISMKAFNYYVKEKSKVRCKELYEYFQNEGDESIQYETTVLYDIYILEKANHIEELLNGIDTIPLAQRSINEYLVSLQYSNKKDIVMSKKYEDYSKEHLGQALKQSTN